jgi:hypothetical protein
MTNNPPQLTGAISIPADSDFAGLMKSLGISPQDVFHIEGGANYWYVRVQKTQKKHRVEQHFRLKSNPDGTVYAFRPDQLDTAQRQEIMREMAGLGMDFRFIAQILDISVSRVIRHLSTK